jgi:hypothetical protein
MNSSFRSKPAIRTLARVLAGLVIGWMLACGLLFGVMRQPPATFAQVMARVPGPVAFLALPFETLWTGARAGSLHLGDLAPDFSLVKLDKTGQVRLSEFSGQQKPVVLVFGSYT